MQIGKEKGAHEVWERLAAGERLNLIVEFDDSAIRVEALRLNKTKGIMFDDNETIRFKAESISIIKKKALSALPSGEFEVLKDYEMLPLLLVRFRTLAALKALLGQPSVKNVHEDRKENLMHPD